MDEKVLKCEIFHSAKTLCDFVNENHLTAEDIQRILVNTTYVLFYWGDK